MRKSFRGRENDNLTSNKLYQQYHDWGINTVYLLGEHESFQNQECSNSNLKYKSVDALFGQFFKKMLWKFIAIVIRENNTNGINEWDSYERKD